jgi:hypothetical protein
VADLILHHYDEAPFAEKIRLVFGIKGLSWQSVIIPAALPKPDLMPLTGGYRRTPVLQIGADVEVGFLDPDHAAPPVTGGKIATSSPGPTGVPGGACSWLTATRTADGSARAAS